MGNKTSSPSPNPKRVVKEPPSFKIAFLGVQNSGKSTLLRHVQVHASSDSVTEKDGRGVAHVLLRDLQLAIRRVNFDVDSKTKAAIEQVSQADTLSQSVADAVKMLVKNKELSSLIKKLQSEAKVTPNLLKLAKQLQKYPSWGGPGWVPHMDTVLETYQPTTGVSEGKFAINSVPYHVLDVGGSRAERRKWIHVLSGELHAICFMVDISTLDRMVDDETNVLEESENVFKQLAHWFPGDIPLFVLFTKCDKLVARWAKDGDALGKLVGSPKGTDMDTFVAVVQEKFQAIAAQRNLEVTTLRIDNTKSQEVGLLWEEQICNPILMQNLSCSGFLGDDLPTDERNSQKKASSKISIPSFSGKIRASLPGKSDKTQSVGASDTRASIESDGSGAGMEQEEEDERERREEDDCEEGGDEELMVVDMSDSLVQVEVAANELLVDESVELPACDNVNAPLANKPAAAPSGSPAPPVLEPIIATVTDEVAAVTDEDMVKEEVRHPSLEHKVSMGAPIRNVVAHKAQGHSKPKERSKNKKGKAGGAIGGGVHSIPEPPMASVVSESKTKGADLAYFSAFAPPSVSGGEAFLLNIWAYVNQVREEVVKMEASKGNSEAGMKGPVRVYKEDEISISLELDDAAFSCDSEEETMEWLGEKCTFQFPIQCKRQAKVGTYNNRARIHVAGKQRAVLLFQLRVARKTKEVSSGSGCFSCLFPSSNKRPESKADKAIPKGQTGPGTNLDATLTLLPSHQNPHIFLSYRRMHIDLADRVRRCLEGFGYSCFLDIAVGNGLGAGDFGAQLKENMDQAAVVVPLLTPKPSGPDDVKKELSSLATCKWAAENGKTDWCLEEFKMMLAAKDEKIILPMFRGVSLDEEFNGLPKEIESLRSLNCRQIHDDLFDASVGVLHTFIQQELKKKEMGSER